MRACLQSTTLDQHKAPPHHVTPPCLSHLLCQAPLCIFSESSTHPMRQLLLLLFPFYKSGNWGSGKLIKSLQVWMGNHGIKSIAVLLGYQAPASSPHSPSCASLTANFPGSAPTCWILLEPLPLCWRALVLPWVNSWASSHQLAQATEGAGAAQGWNCR